MKPVPTLAKFADAEFLPFVRTSLKEKPNTVRFYENSVENLKAHSKLANLPLDAITADVTAGFIAARQAYRQKHRDNKPLEVSTINRDLATLRRMLRLAEEWGRVTTLLPRVKLLGGEKQRERVLSPAEEAAYLTAAAEVGTQLEQAYEAALNGIRAVKRGQMPRRPDAFRLLDVATILVDCALRPDECSRLRAENVRDGAIWIYTGKGDGSRRRVPVSPRVQAILDMRLSSMPPEGWLFPAPTRSGHTEPSTLKKQHSKALTRSKVAPFQLYDLRHTCLTRWAEYMDPFALHKVAGHRDMKTTMRYVHPNDDHIREVIEKVRAAQGGDTSGYTAERQQTSAAQVPAKLM
jgi:integrase